MNGKSTPPPEPQVADEVIEEKTAVSLYKIKPPKWVNDGLYLRTPSGYLILEHEVDDPDNPAWAVHSRTITGIMMGPTTRFGYEPGIGEPPGQAARCQAVEYVESVYHAEVRAWLEEPTDEDYRARFPLVGVHEVPMDNVKIDWDAMKVLQERRESSPPPEKASAIDDKGQILRGDIDMARVFIWQERLVKVIRQLMPLYDEVGQSVNALCNRLNDNLTDGLRIYPNRIHALLSGEKDVALNEHTVAMLEQALKVMGRDPAKIVLTEIEDVVPPPPPEKGTASANDLQVGGDHYRDIEGEQHWDRLVRLFGWSRAKLYFLGQTTKYIERHEKKNGLQDLKKAAHFLQKMIEEEEKYLAQVEKT